jgi:alpha-L-fucosidase
MTHNKMKALSVSPDERDARLAWWREARFGMFIHWGVYSALSGTWRGQRYDGYSEHIQRKAKIPIPVYHREVAGRFNPSDFDADTWVRLAKEAGMGYFVITAKHHDGFAMYDSQVSDATIVKATPFARDPMPDLKAACAKYGLKFGFYYSHAFDWGEENGPGNDWDYENPGGDRMLGGAAWWEQRPDFLPRARRYVDEKSIPQILELIRRYDPDLLWFDTPHKLPPEENLRILAAIREASPSLPINGRLVEGLGDYENTCDMPCEFPPWQGDWEGIPTTNRSYAYNENDRSHKPASFFIRLLAKAVARGGNLLMNIGPMGNGAFDPADVQILEAMAAWWRVYGESIRGAGRTPLAVQAWGESTLKGRRLYLHVFQWPTGGELVVGGLLSDVKRACLLAAPDHDLKMKRRGDDVVVAIPDSAPDHVDSVLVLELVETPRTDPAVLLSSAVPVNRLHVFDARLSGGLAYEDGSDTKRRRRDTVQNWTNLDAEVAWTVRVSERGSFEVSIEYDAEAPRSQARKVEGAAGQELEGASGGSAGTYQVTVGERQFERNVLTGQYNVNETLGDLCLEPGAYDVRVRARAIAGDDLMRLRAVHFECGGK